MWPYRNERKRRSCVTILSLSQYTHKKQVKESYHQRNLSSFKITSLSTLLDASINLFDHVMRVPCNIISGSSRSVDFLRAILSRVILYVISSDLRLITYTSTISWLAIVKEHKNTTHIVHFLPVNRRQQRWRRRRCFNVTLNCLDLNR